MASRRVALLLTLVGTLAAGCYRPEIKSGGFRCADGGACPEGFRCNLIDRRCYRGDGGPEAQLCDALPHLMSACFDEPAAGEACNPACQTGCACGRCTVVGGAVKCAPPGSKNAGDLCDLSVDDCGAGLGCVKDACGTNLGRCHQFCRSTADCAGGCNTLQGSTSICDVPPQTCDPVMGIGCPDPALGCYVQGSQTVCECKGTKLAGETCQFSECAPGFQCITYAMASTCRKVCSGPADCAPPATCSKPTGGPFGFCL